jgi:hypothetical protein
MKNDHTETSAPPKDHSHPCRKEAEGRINSDVPQYIREKLLRYDAAERAIYAKGSAERKVLGS